MEHRVPGWVLGVVGVAVASLFWFLWILLGPVDSHQHEIDQLRSQGRQDRLMSQTEIDGLKTALAQANAERAVENKPPIMVVMPPITSSTTVSPPTVAPTTSTTTCRVHQLLSSGCLVK